MLTKKGDKENAANPVACDPALSACMPVSAVEVSPLGATGWHTNATQIVNPSGGTYVFSGVNWYGAETTAYAPEASGLRTTLSSSMK